MKGIIVAAGLGRVSLPSTRDRARLMPSHADRPLLDQTIEAFARAGFEEVGVVLGPNGDILQRYLEGSARYGIAVYCLHNPMHWRGSATALYAAQPYVHGEPLVVAMAERGVSAHALLALLRDGWSSHVVGVYRRKGTVASGSTTARAWVDRQSCLRDIGEGLQHWNAVAAGAFLFQPQVLDTLGALLQMSADPCSIVGLVRQLLADRQEVRSCEVAVTRQGLPVHGSSTCYGRPILSIGLSSLGVRLEDYLA